MKDFPSETHRDALYRSCEMFIVPDHEVKDDRWTFSAKDPKTKKLKKLFPWLNKNHLREVLIESGFQSDEPIILSSLSGCLEDGPQVRIFMRYPLHQNYLHFAEHLPVILAADPKIHCYSNLVHFVWIGLARILSETYTYSERRKIQAVMDGLTNRLQVRSHD
jgi:hypothetical protein